MSSRSIDKMNAKLQEWAARHEGMKILFVGNPGHGKSTMMNCLIGEVVFKSGRSVGHGLTDKLKIEQVGPLKFVDTPGLDDVTMRKKAAAEITEALKKDGQYMVVFVVGLNEGRIFTSDMTTVSMIWEAAQEKIGENYSILVNKLTEPLDPQEQTDCMALFFAGKKLTPTKHLYFMDRKADLKGNNKVCELPDDFIEWILSAPIVTIPKEEVKPIDGDTWEEKHNASETRLNTAKGDLTTARAELKDTQDKLDAVEKDIQELKDKEPSDGGGGMTKVQRGALIGGCIGGPFGAAGGALIGALS